MVGGLSVPIEYEHDVSVLFVRFLAIRYVHVSLAFKNERKKIGSTEFPCLVFFFGYDIMTTASSSYSLTSVVHTI
jgi:hypothetical protein